MLPFYRPARRQWTPPVGPFLEMASLLIACRPQVRLLPHQDISSFCFPFFLSFKKKNKPLISGVICSFLNYIISFGPSGFKAH